MGGWTKRRRRKRRVCQNEGKSKRRENQRLREFVPGKLRMVTMATAAKSHMTQRSECEIKRGRGGRKGEGAGRAGRRQRRGGVKIEWETVK